MASSGAAATSSVVGRLGCGACVGEAFVGVAGPVAGEAYAVGVGQFAALAHEEGFVAGEQVTPFGCVDVGEQIEVIDRQHTLGDSFAGEGEVADAAGPAQIIACGADR